MPNSVKASGITSALTVGAAATVLLSSTGAAGGEQLHLWLDTSTLGVGQRLEVRVTRAVRAGGTARNVTGTPFIIDQGFAGCAYILGVPPGAAYEFAIVLRGASGTPTVEWSIERPDA
jgi:hypothetical protein